LADISLLVAGQHILLEVKSGKRGKATGQAVLQSIRGKQTNAYLMQEVTDGILGVTGACKTITILWTKQYYSSQVEEGWRTAIQNGKSWQLIDGAILCFCYEPSIPIAKLSAYTQDAMREVGWTRPVVRFGSLLRHFDSLDSDSIRFIRPLTTFGIDPTLIASLLNDEWEITIVVNVDMVCEKLKQTGLRVTDNDNEIEIRARDGDLPVMTLASKPWDELIYGLLTLPSFIEKVRLSFAMGQ
jgi:hypothetical protein